MEHNDCLLSFVGHTHIDGFARPGDMLIVMNRPLSELSKEVEKDLVDAQKDALEISSIIKKFPESNAQAELNLELAAVDTSCLNVDNHVTACVNQNYGSFVNHIFCFSIPTNNLYFLSRYFAVDSRGVLID